MPSDVRIVFVLGTEIESIRYDQRRPSDEADAEALIESQFDRRPTRLVVLRYQGSAFSTHHPQRTRADLAHGGLALQKRLNVERCPDTAVSAEYRPIALSGYRTTVRTLKVGSAEVIERRSSFKPSDIDRIHAG